MIIKSSISLDNIYFEYFTKFLGYEKADFEDFFYKYKKIYDYL